MNGRHLFFGNLGHPLAQIVSLVVLGVVFALAVVMGAFVLMAILGFAVIGFLVFSIRGWWLRRKLRGRTRGQSARTVHYIEAEYEVVDPDDEHRRLRERR
jgi:hypothetical protein